MVDPVPQAEQDAAGGCDGAYSGRGRSKEAPPAARSPRSRGRDLPLDEPPALQPIEGSVERAARQLTLRLTLQTLSNLWGERPFAKLQNGEKTDCVFGT